MLGFSKNGRNLIGYECKENNLNFFLYEFQSNQPSLTLKFEFLFFPEGSSTLLLDGDMEDYHIYYSENNLDSFVFLHVFFDTDTHRNHYYKIFKNSVDFIFLQLSNLKLNSKIFSFDFVSSNGNWVLIQTSTTLEFILFEKKEIWRNSSSFLKEGFSSTIQELDSTLKQSFFVFHFDVEEFLTSSCENLLNYEQKVLVSVSFV
jgi:hypothetical protein